MKNTKIKKEGKTKGAEEEYTKLTAQNNNLWVFR